MEKINNLDELEEMFSDSTKKGVTIIGISTSVNQTSLAYSIAECVFEGVYIYAPDIKNFSKKISFNEAKKECCESSIYFARNDDCISITDIPSITTQDDIYKSFDEFRENVLHENSEHDYEIIIIKDIKKVISDNSEKAFSELKSLSTDLNIDIVVFITADTSDLEKYEAFADNLIILPDNFTGIEDQAIVLIEPSESEKIEVW